MDTNGRSIYAANDLFDDTPVTTIGGSIRPSNGYIGGNTGFTSRVPPTTRIQQDDYVCVVYIYYYYYEYTNNYIKKSPTGSFKHNKYIVKTSHCSFSPPKIYRY